MKNEKLRNVAIIAHVDHGKTSLVNEMLKQGGVFRENQSVSDRMMDSGELEKERGITILAKNCACYYNDVKINLVDTPGHADFGGEVERALNMVDGVLLVVDAYEGPMPQTRFVLEKALELNHKVIVVINKIDRVDSRISEVEDEVLELLMDLDANDTQLNSPFVYASARNGTASTDKKKQSNDMMPLLQKIVEYIDPPEGDETAPLQMLVSATESSEYVGKLAIGKITSGEATVNQNVILTNYHDNKLNDKSRITALFSFDGMKKMSIEKATIGDIVCISGCPTVKIGDTVCAVESPKPIPFTKISEPSIEMTFSVNDSPFAGKEGKFVTSRHLRDRLYKEAEKDLSLKVADTDTTDAFAVRGRGEMHLSILIENMRREGYEFQVSMPKVLYQMRDGVKYEPIDKVVFDIPESSMGSIMDKMGRRKGEFMDMNSRGSRLRLQFSIPSRCLFGYKTEFLTDTRGEGIMTSVHYAFEPYRGDIVRREAGSLIVHETGESVVYGMYNAQERGNLFITAGTPVYMGMVVGENPKGDDIVVNVCKRKNLTNTRASGSDDALRLIPPKIMSLEESLEFLADDELLEVTPRNIRIRKKVLDHELRMKMKFGKKNRC